MSIFLLDDDPAYCQTFSDTVRDGGYNIEYRTNPEDALMYIREHQESLRLVFLDLVLKHPKYDGVDILEIIRKEFPAIAVVMVTGSDKNFSASIARARDLGGKRFIAKTDLKSEQILNTIRDEYRSTTPDRSTDDKEAQEALDIVSRFGLVGVSPALIRIAKQLIRYAKTNLNVMLAGETGTGKKIAANIIHALSQRNRKQMITVDIVNISRELFQSELFGHVKGAFTGALADKNGLFLEADGSTLFIDEIGDMSLDQQANLLLPVQEQRFRPVGGNSEKNVDVRFVCATNRDIPAMCKTERFRSDLFHRLNGVTITLPPLRDRKDDIPVIAQYWVKQFNHKHGTEITIDLDARETLKQYPWYGNVRELEQTLNRILETKPVNGAITSTDVQEAVSTQAEPLYSGGDSRSEVVPVQNMEKSKRAILIEALNAHKGNKSKVANALDITRDTVYRWIKEFGIQEYQKDDWR